MRVLDSLGCALGALDGEPIRLLAGRSPVGVVVSRVRSVSASSGTRAAGAAAGPRRRAPPAWRRRRCGADRHQVRQQRIKLGNFRYRRLQKDAAPPGIDAARQVIEHDAADALRQHGRIGAAHARGERVQIRDEWHHIVLRLELNALLQRADQMAEVEPALGRSPVRTRAGAVICVLAGAGILRLGLQWPCGGNQCGMGAASA